MSNVRTMADQIRTLKETLPKGSPDNVVIIQNGRQPHLYMYTDTHSWKCHCDVPESTRKYFIKRDERDPLHLESAVFEKGFMVPNKVRKAWVKSKDGKVDSHVDITNRYSYTTKKPEGHDEPDEQSLPVGARPNSSLLSRRPKSGMVMPRDDSPSRASVATSKKGTIEWRDDSPSRSSVATSKRGTIVGRDDSPSRSSVATSKSGHHHHHKKKKKKRVVVIDLSTGPITAQKPFRVSSAHWASMKHTQQWPWKGTLQCRLVGNSGSPHTAWSRHTHCWANEKKH